MRVTQFFVLCGIIATTMNVAGCANHSYAFRKRCVPTARVCCYETSRQSASPATPVNDHEPGRNEPTIANSISVPLARTTERANEARQHATGANSPAQPTYEIHDPQPESPPSTPYFTEPFAANSPQPSSLVHETSNAEGKIATENSLDSKSADQLCLPWTPWKALKWLALPVDDLNYQSWEFQPATPTEPVMISPAPSDESNQIDDDADEGWVENSDSPVTQPTRDEPVLTTSSPSTSNLPAATNDSTLRLQASTHHPQRFLSSITQQPELKRGANQPTTNSSAMRPISYSLSGQSLTMDPTYFRPLPTVDVAPNAASELLGATKLDSNSGASKANATFQPIERPIHDSNRATRLQAIPTQPAESLPPVVRIKLFNSSDSPPQQVARTTPSLTGQSDSFNEKLRRLTVRPDSNQPQNQIIDR